MIVVIDSAPTEMLATTLMSRHQRSDDPAGSFFFFFIVRHNSPFSPASLPRWGGCASFFG